MKRNRILLAASTLLSCKNFGISATDRNRLVAEAATELSTEVEEGTAAWPRN